MTRPACVHLGETRPDGLSRCGLHGSTCSKLRRCDRADRWCQSCPDHAETPMDLTPESAAALLRSKVMPWPRGARAWGSDAVRAGVLQLLAAHMTRVPAPSGSGRGVVSCVSAKPGHSSGKHLEHGYFPAAWVQLHELRRLGCTLPVTWCHLGPAEMDGHLKALVEPLGVTVVDLLEWNRTPAGGMRVLAGWESKVAAVFAAGYAETLFLDADCTPVHNPTFLFDRPEYLAAGAVYWPDVPPADGRKEWLPEACWLNCGVPYPGFMRYRAFESGQFVVDARRHAAALWATRFFNEYSDHYYQSFFGDKDLFLMGCLATGTPFAMPPRGPQGTGSSLRQCDFDGRALFNHGTRNKPTLAGFPRPDVLEHRGHCDAHLAALRAVWDGRMYATTTDAATAARVVGLWEYERVGLGTRPLELLPTGRVGRGAAGREQSWTVTSAGGAPVLNVIGHDRAVTMALAEDAAGRWVGRWVDYERNGVVLTRTGA